MPAAIYLFCLTAHGRTIELDLSAPPGYGDLVQVDEGNITAVACEVPLGDFAGESAEEHLESLDWVGPRAVYHGDVVREVMDHRPVLPSRFGTLFSSKESLARFVAANYETIAGFLDRVTGHEEWGLKVLISKDKAIEYVIGAEMASHAADLASASPGIRYVKEKQFRNRAEKTVAARAHEIGRTVVSQMGSFASDLRRRATVQTDDRRGDISVAGHWAFLLPRGKAPEFVSAVNDANSRHEAAGLLFETSGPWPPYSFTPALRTEL
ncbi:MAG: GvpL/GvpF family gas vesicle protein [Deltaproteobacteria bacterium]